MGGSGLSAGSTPPPARSCPPRVRPWGPSLLAQALVPPVRSAPRALREIRALHQRARGRAAASRQLREADGKGRAFVPRRPPPGFGWELAEFREGWGAQAPSGPCLGGGLSGRAGRREREQPGRRARRAPGVPSGSQRLPAPCAPPTPPGRGVLRRSGGPPGGCGFRPRAPPRRPRRAPLPDLEPEPAPGPRVDAPSASVAVAAGPAGASGPKHFTIALQNC